MFHMDSKVRQKIIEKEGTEFPAKTYKKLVLEPAFNHAKENFILPMIQIHLAHLIMLVEQRIVAKDEALNIYRAIKKIDIGELKKHPYDPSFEDLFFQIEHFLIEEAGDIAGNLHIARSRNDMGIAIYRMTLREKLLNLIQAALNFRQCLIELTSEHIDTVMIGYTHTQQAQPTTLAHYFNAMTDVLTRDIRRLMAAYQTVNRSSMGAAALTTSGFPINRKRVQELLGFEDMIDNAWDAVAGADYIGETAAAVQLAGINLGRSAQDFLLWGTQEFGCLKLASPFVQISSIMPQKRNPVSIEHIRSLLSTVAGNAQTVLTMIHNTPFGDIVDTEDDMQPYMWKAIDCLQNVYGLFAGVLMTMEVNREKLLERAKKSFANVTELADTLVRTDRLSFRKAHEIVSAAVRELSSEGKESLDDFHLDLLNRHAEKIIGRKLSITEEQFRNALDPVHFVRIRSLEGGPSPERMTNTVRERIRQQEELEKWAEEKGKRLKEKREQIEQIFEGWVRENE
jgi:argininosuccinate lyase